MRGKASVVMVLALALAVPTVGSIIPPPASVLEVSALTQISQWAAYNTARRRAARAQMFAEQSAAFATCQATNPNPAECGQAPERPSQPSGASYFWQVVVAIKAGAVCRAQGILVAAVSTPLGGYAAGTACGAVFAA